VLERRVLRVWVSERPEVCLRVREVVKLSRRVKLQEIVEV
jgi:hypothetical protein